ncbi:CP2 transcription factor [Aspergillus sp. HF37]|nr:CP2 transcription factor [Aspergillus sp. HF37]
MAILRNRNSHKPDKQLIRRFQQSFPDVARRVRRENAPETPAGINNATAVGVDTMADLGHSSTLDDDMELLSSWTPRHWQHLRVPTPWMDPDFAASSLMPGGQQFGVGTPGMGPILHNQAGDLHTPTMGLNGTPLPFPSYIDPSALTGGGLEQYYDPPLFGQCTPGLNPNVQQATDAPGSLMRHDSGSAAAGDASVLDSSSLGETRFSLASNAKSSRGLLSDKTSPLNAKDRK